MGRRIGSRRKKLREEKREENRVLRAKHEAYMEQRKVTDAAYRAQAEAAEAESRANYEKTKLLTAKLTELGFPMQAGYNGHLFFKSSYAIAPEETLLKLIEALS